MSPHSGRRPNKNKCTQRRARAQHPLCSRRASILDDLLCLFWKPCVTQALLGSGGGGDVRQGKRAHLGCAARDSPLPPDICVRVCVC